MQSEYLLKHTCNCSSRQKQKTKKPFFPIITSILIALLPKCPYCILAYSSAITMCRGAKIYSNTPGWTSYFLLALAILTLIFVLFNYKGKRTIIAASLVAIGTFSMLGSQFYTFQITHYYVGTILIFFGVWINANFRFFYRHWIRPAFKKIISKILNKNTYQNSHHTVNRN